MYTRIFEKKIPKSSFFLFGPRQVGKSTLLKKQEAEFTIDLLDPELQLMYTKNPNLLSQQIDELPPSSTIFIDEVQRVPKLLDVIHSLMEKKPRMRFILCGSSARKLRHGASNLLGGRALYRTMHPLSLEELSSTFNLERVLSYGSLPKMYTKIKQGKISAAQDLLRAYVTTYLREEIKAEALVRNLQGFQLFLDVAAAQFAEQVNFSSIARDCQIALSTVREYYTILEDTLLGFFLYPYLKSQRKRMSHQPKFYFFDNGITRALLGMLQEKPSPIEHGRLYEQWIIQEVVRYNEYHQKDWKLSFWRTSHGAEVDILISRGTRLLYAIECKSSLHPSSRNISGLRAFHETHPDVLCFIVAPVKHAYRLSFIKVLPATLLFKELR